MGWGGGLGGCGCCGTGGGGGTIPGCGCTAIPINLTLTSSNQTIDFGTWKTSPITYQPLPACFAGLGLPANIFTSYPTGFTDPFGGPATFYYTLQCNSGQMVLSRVYCISTYGSPFQDGQMYIWPLTAPNACSPFAMTSGTPQFGGPVTLTLV